MGSSICKKQKVQFQCVPGQNRKKSNLATSKGVRSLFVKNSTKLASMMHVGPEVGIEEKNTILVFIFGGPSSKKGTIVNEIMTTYNFKLIRMENIILEQIAASTKIKNPNDAISQVTEYVKTNPDLLELKWALKELKKEIVKDLSSRYLVELIPNLKCFVTNEAFIKDPTEELKSFEHQFPISFAIEFSIEMKQLIIDLTTAVSQVIENRAIFGQDLSEYKKSDEADKARTKTRTLWYANCVERYINYFKRSGRLVSIHTGTFPLPLVWSRLCRIFADFNIHYEDNEGIKIIFTFGKNKLTDKDLRVCGLLKVEVTNQLVDLDATPVSVLQETCKQINKCEPSTKNFYVHLGGTTVKEGAKIEPSNKSIVFFEPHNVPLPEICRPSLITDVDCRYNFKVVSTPENVNCIFPDETDKKLCEDITVFMSEFRKYI